jgi:predicted permease
VVGRYADVAVVLAAASLLLFAAALANTVNLVQGARDAWAHDLAVRLSLGATPVQLARLPLLETTVCCLAGCGVAWILAWLSVRVAPLVLHSDTPRLQELTIEPLGLAFRTSVVALPCFAFVVASVCQHIVRDAGVSRLLGAGLRPPRRGNPRLTLTAQIAAAVALVLLAGLTIRTFDLLYRRDVGFDPRDLLAAHVSLVEPGTAFAASQSQSREGRQARAVAAMTTFLQSLRSQPGIRAAEVINHWPFSEATGYQWFDDNDQPVDDEAAWFAAENVVSAGYFELMGIALVEGRVFSDREMAAAGTLSVTGMTVISRSLASRLWPGGGAVGRSIGDLRVVGVVADVRFAGFDRDPIPRMYVPYGQRTPGYVMVLMRTSDPASALTSLRTHARAVFGAGTPVFGALTGEQLLRQWLGDQRVTTILVTMFGAVSLLLAMVGVYAVLTSVVAARKREIGVRVALGADRRHLTGWLCQRIAAPVVVGMGVGLAGAAVVARILDSIFFGAATFSMSTVAAVVITLLAAGALAAALPLIQAFRVDPVSLLRAE